MVAGERRRPAASSAAGTITGISSQSHSGRSPLPYQQSRISRTASPLQIALSLSRWRCGTRRPRQRHARRSSPASVSGADIEALAGNPRCAAGWNSTSSTWSWRRTGRRTRVSPTAARPRNATPGRAGGASATWSRGHRWSGPRGAATACHAAAALPAAAAESGCGSHGVVGWSAPGSTSMAGGCVRCEAAGCARQSSSSAFHATGSGS